MSRPRAVAPSAWRKTCRVQCVSTWRFAKRTLAAAPIAPRYALGLGALEPALRLDGREVLGEAVPGLDRPGGAARQDLVELPRVEGRDAARADARRDRGVERVHERLEAALELGRLEAGAEEPHAAVDVEADRSRAHDAPLRVGRADAAAGQAVALVDVGHPQGPPPAPRQRAA